MMKIEFSETDFASVLGYVNGDGPNPGTDTIKRFFHIGDALRSRMLEELKEKTSENGSLKVKLARFDRRENVLIEQGEFGRLGFTAQEIALAILFLLKRIQGVRLTQGLLQHILYLGYAGWLGNHNQALCLDHPECGGRNADDGTRVPMGPWFWSVATSVKVDGNVSEERYQYIAKENPGLAKYLYNLVVKYSAQSESSLREYLVRSRPYKEAMPENNGGKWNKRLSDSEIYQWKAEEHRRSAATVTASK